MIANIKSFGGRIAREISRNCYKLKFNFRKFFYVRSSLESLIFTQPIQRDKIFLFSIAFNNVDVIKYQIKLINKNLSGDFIYCIVDNSSDLQKSNEIRTLCTQFEIPYILLPRKFNINNLKKYINVPSFSHGLALNWLYNNFILVNKISKFGFFDHDIFPIKNMCR